MPVANCVRKARTFNESISKVHCSDRRGGREEVVETVSVTIQPRLVRASQGVGISNFRVTSFTTKYTEIFGHGHGAQVQAQVVACCKAFRAVARGSHVTQVGLGRELHP
jgi:hypothetical protein